MKLTVRQAKRYILLLRDRITRLSNANVELRDEVAELDATRTKVGELRKLTDRLAEDLFSRNEECQLLADELELVTAKLETALRAPARQSSLRQGPILDGNEWRTLARRLLESGQMTGEQWASVLDALLAQRHETSVFNESVEHGFRASFARSDARKLLDDSRLA